MESKEGGSDGCRNLSPTRPPSPPTSCVCVSAREKRTEVSGALWALAAAPCSCQTVPTPAGTAHALTHPRHVMCDDEAMRLADLTSRPYSASKALGIGGAVEVGGAGGAGQTADNGLVPLSAAC